MMVLFPNTMPHMVFRIERQRISIAFTCARSRSNECPPAHLPSR
jgi:hypothetical protein